MNNAHAFCIGMDVHFGYNGDRNPGRVVAISKTGHTITVEIWHVLIGSRRDSGLTESNWQCDFEPAHQGIGPCPEQYKPVLATFTWSKKHSCYIERKGIARLGKGMCYARNPHI